MGTVKHINIKNRTYYFHNDIIDLGNFDSSLLKLDKKPHKDIDIYNIGYFAIKKIGDCKNIYSVNPLYLRINHAHGYIECSSAEEENENKYLIFDSIELHSINENKKLLKNYNDIFDGIMDKIKKGSNDECDYEKDYMKINLRR